MMKGWLQNNLSKIKEALFKTRTGLQSQPVPTKDLIIEINDDFYDDLLEKFIKADIGIDLSEKIVSNVRNKITDQKINKSKIQIILKDSIRSVVGAFHETPLQELSINGLNILLIVGVNGSGKTTSIGKLAKHFKEEDFKVLIVAADTFRAAAGEQLDIWAQKAGVEIFSPPDIKKPDAVIFNAIEKAKKDNYNLLLVDTAGRLHSQTNLMDELKKIDAVIVKACHGMSSVKTLHATSQQYEKLIVLDATIGQNAIIQAELFSKAIGLTGIILSKLDSSAKGGVILNIMNKLSLPVKLIGTGEKIDDLAQFNMNEYLEGLLI